MNNVQCFIKDFTLINSDLQKALDFSYGAHDTILIVFSVMWRGAGGDTNKEYFTIYYLAIILGFGLFYG